MSTKEEVMKKLEAEGMQKVKELKQKKGGVILLEKELMAIMQKGADEFEEKVGRSMTYGEMREMYG